MVNAEIKRGIPFKSGIMFGRSLIEGYYDKSTQVLYLHLRSVEDTHYRCEALIKEKRSGIKKCKPQTDFANRPYTAHEGKTFLQQHIDLAFTKGFDDRVGRHTSNAHFELTTAAVWVEACKLVYSFFMEDPIEQKHKQVAHAVSVLAQHARGASSEKYMEQLQEECDRYWRAGRQMCEVPSLTGNPCTNPIHRATEEEEPCKEALTR
ncbi:hypothetical protein B566_EDAN009791 [Ephemera danica]|nr:hypothetical protein B566_EDAN009791 [Ephemera danica]